MTYRLRIPSAVLGLVAGCVLLGIGLLAGSASAADKDCSDFSSQAAAQRFFEKHGGPRRDPHRLDGDGDGVACESNPCPCLKPGSGGGGKGGGGKQNRPKKTAWARVVSVVDGDTIKVKLKGRTRDVRLIGIDTPEVYGGAECGGREASRSMKRALDRGDRVKLIRDFSQDNRDRYRRLLRYVERKGSDLGRRQVRDGWAKPYVYERPFKRLRSYRRAKHKAKRADRGVWGKCGGFRG
jgi:endonuclease YncB( thermonuclease family)